MKKLSFLMAMVIILSSFPMLFSVSTLAAEADYEAVIGDKGYASLEEAITAATTGQTITLLKDVTVDSAAGITILDATGRNLTIDGNGKTITSTVSTNNRATFYVQSGSLTLKNLTMDTTSTGSLVWGASISKNTGVTVTYDNCFVKVRGSVGKSAIGSIFGGKVVLKDTVVVSERPLFYDYDGKMIIEATNSTAVATSLGISAAVSGLSYVENATPFSVVAAAGSTAYTSLETAVTEVATNVNTASVIELLTDTTVDSNGMTVDAVKAVTVNGNGNTVSGTITGGYVGVFYVRKNTVTLNDMTIDATLANANTWGPIMVNGATAKIVTNNCDIKARGSSATSAMGLNGGGIIELNDTNITSVFKLIYLFNNNATMGTVKASNSTATAPSMGDTVKSVEGLTFTANSDPFGLAVASIGTTIYSSFETAINAAVASSQASSAAEVTVKLLKDTEIDGNGTVLGTNGGAAFNVVVDGNGHTITNLLNASGNCATFYNECGVLTIKNMTVNTTCEASAAFGAIIARRAATTKVIVENVNINIDGSKGFGSGIFLNENACVEFKGDNVIRSVFKAVTGTGTAKVTDGTTKIYAPACMTVTGATITTTTDPFELAVASAGGVNYGSLEAAVTAVAKNENTATVIELLKNTTVDGDGIIVDAEKSFTINGNGHTVSGVITTGARGIFYVRKNTLTLNNIKLDATLANEGSWGAILTNNIATGNNAKIVVNDSEINVRGTAGTSAMGLNAGSAIELNNTTIISVFKLIYLHNNDPAMGKVTANNSTATAPSIGDTIKSVAGLTFIQNPDPYNTSDAAIGTKLYATLPEAFAAAKTGDVITLLRDINVTTTGSAGRINCTINNAEVTLNGNGKTITSVADVVLAILHNKEASVENGSNSSVHIKDLTIISNDSTSYGTVLQLNTDTKVTLDNCKLNSAKKNTLGTALLQTGSTLVLCGGTEIAPTAKGNAIYFNGANSSVTIEDATVAADRAFYMKHVGLKITICAGADISVNSELFAINGDAVPVVNISGGKIKSANANAPIITVKNANAKVNVFGGSFEGGNAIFENTVSGQKLAYTSGNSEKLFPVMKNGASARLVAESTGLRFRTTIPKALIDHINAVKDEGTTVSYGTLIAPAEYVEAANGLFTMSALDRCTTILGAKYLNIAATENGILVNPDGSVTINAAITNIKLANYIRDFAATGYIVYTIGGETHYVYTEYSVENNSRNIHGVACAALADVSATQDSDIYKYPVTSYLVKETDGTYSKVQKAAFSKYSDDQRKILTNYYKLIPNHDEVTLETVTKTVADNVSTTFRTIGRSYVRNNGLACDFTASGIEFSAYCAGPVCVKINSSGISYYTLYIDGVRQPNRIQVNAKNTEWIQIAYAVEGNHTFTLVKQSQPSVARTEILEVKLDGSFNAKPADKELFIEFYGDSILNGSNVIYEAGVSTNVHNSDGTQAFGWLTAEALGADASIIGRGGMAILSKTNDTDYNMMMLYELNGAYEAGNATKYDFARKPDIVVVELGINDFVKGECKNNPATFKTAVTNFVAALRAKYGNDVAIVWLYGYSTDDYSSVAMEALDVIKAAGDGNIYYCQMPSNLCYSGAGDTDKYHPTQAGAKVMAETLTAFIKANILK